MSESREGVLSRMSRDEIVQALENEMTPEEIGEHITDDFLLPDSDAEEYAGNILAGGYRLLGICHDVWKEQPIFSDSALDVGICAEKSDKKRYWIHFNSARLKKVIEDLKDDYFQDFLNNILFAGLPQADKERKNGSKKYGVLGWHPDNVKI